MLGRSLSDPPQAGDAEGMCAVRLQDGAGPALDQVLEVTQREELLASGDGDGGKMVSMSVGSLNWMNR